MEAYVHAHQFYSLLHDHHDGTTSHAGDARIVHRHDPLPEDDDVDRTD